MVNNFIPLIIGAHIEKDISKKASQYTKKSNERYYQMLPFDNKEDFEDASRGFIGKLENPIIKDENEKIVWDLNQYNFLKKEQSPDTVNPSLWRQARLNMLHGLFKVTDKIYQVRGYDLSVISFIKSKNGYIVIDPLISAECAKTALELVYKHLGKKPVFAVIYTHSHVDHYGGVKGVVSEEDVNSGKVKIIAPEGFMEEAISENVLAGNAMSRRASYMYGSLLPKGKKGQVDGGLGKTTSNGTVTLIPPTDIITKTGQEMDIDGVKIVFQMTPGTEAPAEMHFYFPQFRALCLAENCTHNLHNLYTLRGAKVRDSKAWAYYINEAIELFADKSDVVFASHHWPRWGKERILDFMKKQRDMYKYIHDQTLRLANHGYTMTEIAELIRLPQELSHEWHNRGYYGSINHDAKAVYQRYLGWFDGNPSNLHQLPPVESSKKYVEFMGGAKEVISKAQIDFKNGQYRWVAQVVNHVVFADPNNKEARNLLSDALEQLGYQAESGPWRNFYLTGAKELRKGIDKRLAPTTGSPDTVKAMNLDMFFDYLAIRLNGPKAEGKNIKLNFNFTDTKENYLITLENSVLNYSSKKQIKDTDANITLTRDILNKIILGETKLKDAISSKNIIIEGNKEKLKDFLSLLDSFNFWFNIVTP